MLGQSILAFLCRSIALLPFLYQPLSFANTRLNVRRVCEYITSSNACIESLQVYAVAILLPHFTLPPLLAIREDLNPLSLSLACKQCTNTFCRAIQRCRKRWYTQPDHRYLAMQFFLPYDVCVSSACVVKVGPTYLQPCTQAVTLKICDCATILANSLVTSSVWAIRCNFQCLARPVRALA